MPDGAGAPPGGAHGIKQPPAPTREAFRLCGVGLALIMLFYGGAAMVDFNVIQNKKAPGFITNTARIDGALPTLLEKSAKSTATATSPTTTTNHHYKHHQQRLRHRPNISNDNNDNDKNKQQR